jgi:hypothetical protein
VCIFSRLSFVCMCVLIIREQQEGRIMCGCTWTHLHSSISNSAGSTDHVWVYMDIIVQQHIQQCWIHRSCVGVHEHICTAAYPTVLDLHTTCRVGQNRTYIRIYGVYTLMIAGKSPCIRSYSVYVGLVQIVHWIFILLYICRIWPYIRRFSVCTVYGIWIWGGMDSLRINP